MLTLAQGVRATRYKQLYEHCHPPLWDEERPLMSEERLFLPFLDPCTGQRGLLLVFCKVVFISSVHAIFFAGGKLLKGFALLKLGSLLV